MANKLIPCGGCSRHIRPQEALCPFCGVSITQEVAPEGARARPRMGRAALFTVGAAMLAVSGCGDDGPDSPDGGGAVPLYGGPPVMDSGPMDADPEDAMVEDADVPDADGSPAALYGGPPADAG